MKAKIYTVFMDSGYDTARLHYRRSVINENGNRIPKNFLSNEDLAKKLEASCDAEFIVRHLECSTKGHERIMGEIGELKEELDGVIVIGAHRNRRYALSGKEEQPILFTGLPTINVDNLFKLQSHPYSLFGEGKILTAQIDREQILEEKADKEMFDDLMGKINIMVALRKMREAKILLIKDPDATLDKEDYKIFPPRYNDIVMSEITNTFGIEFIVRDVKELNERYQDISDARAGEIAQMWISEARKVDMAREDEILSSAKLYLAIDEIITDTGEEISAIMVQNHKEAIEGLTTTTSLPMLEFHKRGIVGSYQSYTGCTLAQMFARVLLGRNSFVHDQVADTYNNITFQMHCGCPVTDLWGDKKYEYTIRDYTTGKWSEELKSREGAVPGDVNFPAGVPVTVWKFVPKLKVIQVYTGTSVDGHSIYKEWDDIICRNKLAVKVDDAKKIQSHWNVVEYGCHRTATFGDLREQIKQLGTFIGYEVMELDK